MSYIRIVEQLEPTTPPANRAILYVDSADSSVKVKLDTGQVIEIGVDGGGDVSGPAGGSTDNALVLFDGTDGTLIKNSSIISNGTDLFISTNAVLRFGPSNGLDIYHSGIDAGIDNELGDIHFHNAQIADGDIIFRNQGITKDIINKLGTATSATSFNVLDSADTSLLIVQGDGTIGMGIATPHVSALLQLDSTTQGFITPRMTQIQRDAIVSPTQGLQIFNTNAARPEFYNGAMWWGQEEQSLDMVLQIGNDTGGENIIITAASIITSPTGDPISILAGPGANGPGGALSLIAGDGQGGAQSHVGGNLTLHAGDSVGGSDSGDVELFSGKNASSGRGGNIDITAGRSGGGGGAGGGITLTTGEAWYSNVSSGDIELICAGATGFGSRGGDIKLTSGSSTHTGSVANGGDIEIQAGTGDGTGKGGNIEINSGTTLGTGVDSAVILQESGGNVGIGIATPDTKLHVWDGTAGSVEAIAFTTLAVERNGNNYISFLNPDSSRSGINFGSPVSNLNASIIYNDGGTTGGYQFRTVGNVTKMVIQSGGNVGIGTSTPGAKLHIWDSTDVTGSGGGALRIGASATDYLAFDNNEIQVHVASAPSMLYLSAEGGGVKIGSTTDGTFSVNNDTLSVTANNKVGIGTDTPTSHFQVDTDFTETLTGTVDIQIGNSLLDGLGTAFLTELAVGHKIKVNGLEYTVASITDNDTAFITTTFPTTTFGLDILSAGHIFSVRGPDDAQVFGIDEAGIISASNLPAYGTNQQLQYNNGGILAGATGIEIDSGSNLHLKDDNYLMFGDGFDMSIYHDGTDNYIASSLASGELKITHGGVGGGDIFINNISTDKGVVVKLGATDADSYFKVNASDNDTLIKVVSDGRVAIGNNATPASNALLTLVSTTRGFIPPKMTQAQMTSIPTGEAEGMQLYDTTNELLKIHDTTRWRSLLDPANVITISCQEDWDDLIVLGEINITTNMSLLVKTSIETDAEIIINGSVHFSLLGDKLAGVGITYTGAGDFITGDGVVFLRIHGFASLDGDGTGTFLNIQNSPVFIEVSSIGAFNWDDLGTLTDCAQFRIPTAGFFHSGAGFKLNGIGKIFLKEMAGANAVSHSGAWFTIKNTPKTTMISATISEDSITLQSDESLLDINPNVGDTSRIRVNGVILTGSGELFESSTGTTGVFTATQNVSITQGTIASVTDSSGIARFNWSPGATVFIGQIITLSGFTTSTTYNVTGEITVVGSGYCELSTVAFDTNDTSGQFTSAIIELTETTTALVAGDTLVMDTDDATDYDGGGKVFEKGTNYFRINRTYTSDLTGTWNTKPLDQTDVRVLAFSNPGFADSTYVATSYVNGNTTATGTIVNDTYTDMVFGTGGSALVKGSTMERWKLIDDVKGTFEYTGNEPFNGFITFDFTVESGGGTDDFKFKWLRDSGGGFSALDDDVEALVTVGTDSMSISKTFPLSCDKGCQIKPQITRTSGASGITSTYATIYVTV